MVLLVGIRPNYGFDNLLISKKQKFSKHSSTTIWICQKFQNKKWSETQFLRAGNWFCMQNPSWILDTKTKGTCMPNSTLLCRKISQQMPKNVTTSWYLSQKNFILMPICAPNPAFWHSDWWRNSPKQFKRKILALCGRNNERISQEMSKNVTSSLFSQKIMKAHIYSNLIFYHTGMYILEFGAYWTSPLEALMQIMWCQIFCQCGKT